MCRLMDFDWYVEKESLKVKVFYVWFIGLFICEFLFDFFIFFYLLWINEVVFEFDGFKI